MVDVAKKVRAERRAKDLTQKELAERMNVSRTHIAAIETGQYNPSLKMLERIAGALNVSASVFLEDVPQKREAYYRLENEEIDVLDKFRRLDVAKRHALLEILDSFVSSIDSIPRRRGKKSNEVVNYGDKLSLNNGDNCINMF